MEYLRRKIGISCKESPMLIGWRIKTERKEKSPHPRVHEESVVAWGDKKNIPNPYRHRYSIPSKIHNHIANTVNNIEDI